MIRPFSQLFGVRGGVGVTLALVVFGAQAEEAYDYSLREAISQSATAIKGEILKVISGKKSVLEGIASFRQERRLQEQAATLQRDLIQPAQICQTMDAADALAGGAMTRRLRAAQDQRKIAKALSGSVTSVTALENRYKESNNRFCPAEDVAQGICSPTQDSRYVNLSGGDRDALYLFQTRAGHTTYEGSASSGQVEAVNAYISRVTNGGAPPEALPWKDPQRYSNSPQARSYVELSRRYEALMSMSAYSLNSIKGSRTPAN